MKLQLLPCEMLISNNLGPATLTVQVQLGSIRVAFVLQTFDGNHSDVSATVYRVANSPYILIDYVLDEFARVNLYSLYHSTFLTVASLIYSSDHIQYSAKTIDRANHAINFFLGDEERDIIR